MGSMAHSTVSKSIFHSQLDLASGNGMLTLPREGFLFHNFMSGCLSSFPIFSWTMLPRSVLRKSGREITYATSSSCVTFVPRSMMLSIFALK